jgi:MFS transporter, PAT family, beta-lactamase induction signal transducer AmpG
LIRQRHEPDIIPRDAQRHDTTCLYAHAAGAPGPELLELTAPGKPTLLQALGDKRLLAVLLLNFASGLPFNLSNFSLQAWLASVGLNIKTIGIFTLVALPYSFKWLWAPFLDRYLPPFLGRRRGWIVIFQAGLTVCIGVMGMISPTEELRLLGVVTVLMVFLSASQDIVIDAYRIDTIPPSERGLAAAAAAFGYRTAAMLAGTVLVYIAGELGWRLAFLGVACLMAATMLATLRAPEPESPGERPGTLAAAVWHPLQALMAQPGMKGFLLLILLYKVGDALALSLYSTFMLRGVGFSLQELSIAGKLNMTISTMVGVALGGWIYLRWGTFRSLLVFGIGQSLTNLLYAWLAIAGKKIWLLVLATCLDTMVGGMGQAAFVAFLVSLCSTNFSATQYALLSALAILPSKVTGVIAGFLVPVVGWANFFVITCMSALPGLVVLVLLRQPLIELSDREAAKAAAG